MPTVSGFDLKVEYLPGKKKQILADTLSRAGLDGVPAEEDELQVNKTKSKTRLLRLKKKSKIVPSAMTMLRRKRKSH